LFFLLSLFLFGSLSLLPLPHNPITTAGEEFSTWMFQKLIYGEVAARQACAFVIVVHTDMHS
jgi:hypothetical protein